MFRDRIRVKFKAGKGGNGRVSFAPGRHPHPAGGIGGDGGSVYLEGSNNVYDLSLINEDATYKAGRGEDGGVNNLRGKTGDDLIFKVPLTTKVYDQDENLLLTIDKHGDRKLLLNGGVGGLGNYYFRTTGLVNLRKATPGYEGDEIAVSLILELYSDIIFIGYPNAGKSSILNAITNADSKVAAYEFTTLNPKIGRLDSLVLMDLPGLIEGTATGKGLGTSFVKHTKASRLVAHMVSLEADVESHYTEIRKELELIDPELAAKPEVIILTKSDLVSKEVAEEKLRIMKKFKKEIFICSVYDYDSLEGLKVFLKENLVNS